MWPIVDFFFWKNNLLSGFYLQWAGLLKFNIQFSNILILLLENFPNSGCKGLDTVLCIYIYIYIYIYRERERLFNKYSSSEFIFVMMVFKVWVNIKIECTYNEKWVYMYSKWGYCKATHYLDKWHLARMTTTVS